MPMLFKCSHTHPDKQANDCILLFALCRYGCFEELEKRESKKWGDENEVGKTEHLFLREFCEYITTH